MAKKLKISVSKVEQAKVVLVHCLASYLLLCKYSKSLPSMEIIVYFILKSPLGMFVYSILKSLTPHLIWECSSKMMATAEDPSSIHFLLVCLTPLLRSASLSPVLLTIFFYLTSYLPFILGFFNFTHTLFHKIFTFLSQDDQTTSRYFF